MSGQGHVNTNHAIPLVFDGPDEVREVVQAAADDALVFRHRGADARKLELVHAGRQRPLCRAQPCTKYYIIIHLINWRVCLSNSVWVFKAYIDVSRD